MVTFIRESVSRCSVRYDEFHLRGGGAHCSSAFGLSPGRVFLNYCFPFELPVRSAVSHLPLPSPTIPLILFSSVPSHHRSFSPLVRVGRNQSSPMVISRIYDTWSLFLRRSRVCRRVGSAREDPESAGKNREEEAARCVSMFTRRNKRRRRRRHRRAVISYYFGL